MSNHHPYYCKECGGKIYYAGNNTWWCPECKEHKRHIEYRSLIDNAISIDEEHDPAAAIDEMCNIFG